ncbi:ph-response sensor protein [Sporothrix epigloea]|uniref:Ph-response sensor protein n=1 Tax=Sporothrix epigloea TaxID=1892477 RepID=A0ABP0DUU9_9PEZI
MGDSRAPPPPDAAAAGGAEGAGPTDPVPTVTTPSAPSPARTAASVITARGPTATWLPPQSMRPDRRGSDTAQPPSSRKGQQQGQGQDQEHSHQQQHSQPSHTPHGTLVAATSPPGRRSFFSRLSLPFRAPAKTIADFHIRPAEPHRTYVAGDHVLGAVVLTVVKPVRITHLTVSLRGLVCVFKDPNAAATASLPADTATESSPSAAFRLLPGKPSTSSASSSSSYLGNGHALLFRDEMVLSGPGRLGPGNYEFEFDLIFPSHGLPSSIDFERGSICYVVTATLTRPTTVAPIQSCDRRVLFVEAVDIGAVPKPRPRMISLEPISKRSRKRKIVITTQPPHPSQIDNPALMHAEVPIVRGTMSTISFASGGGSSDHNDIATLSECGSALDSPLETMQSEEVELEGYAETQPSVRNTSQPRSPVLANMRSEKESVASGGSGHRSGNGGGGLVSAAAGSGSGSGFGTARGPETGMGAGSNMTRLSSPVSSNAAASTTGHSTATATGTNISSSTIANPAAGGSGNGQTLYSPLPARSVSTTTISGGADERTITATVDLLKGGCLRGEVVSVKVSVQHVKRIKSLHGVVVTLYRQGRIDSAPPEYLFSSTATSLAEDSNDADGNRSGTLNESTAEMYNNGSDGQARLQSRKGKEPTQTGDSSRTNQKVRPKDSEQSRQRKGSKEDKSSSGGSAKADSYYPKSKTGLGGLSLMSAGTCSVFRKDLSQSFSPLIIDPRTLQSSVTASVRMPEDAFATIKGVPGDMISFKYQLEVIIDLGGKLANLLQSGVGPAGPSLVSKSSNPYDSTPTTTSAIWGGGSHMIETDQLRRQKGVICVAFEVVVGTTDTTRQRSRGLKIVADGLQQESSQYEHAQQSPQPYPSHHHADDRFPEDRKDFHRQHLHRLRPHELYPGWSADDAPTGTILHDTNQQRQSLHYGPSAPSASDLAYMSHGALSVQAPQYIPTAGMLAGERDPNLSEKERIRRAEQRLLPSQPATTASAAVVGEGSGSSSRANRHAPSAPSAPQLDDLEAPNVQSLPLPPLEDSGWGPSQQPQTEDKQELERRRLLTEASAPPEFPEDYDEAGPSMGRSSFTGTTRAHVAGATSDVGQSAGPSGGSVSAANFAPSAPVLEEEDAHHDHYYSPSSAYHHPSSFGHPAQGAASGSNTSASLAPVPDTSDPTLPSAPTAESLMDAGTSPSAPPGEDVESGVAHITDVDRYGRNYTYGPGSGPEASSSRTNEHTEPLPKYER